MKGVGIEVRIVTEVSMSPFLDCHLLSSISSPKELFSYLRSMGAWIMDYHTVSAIAQTTDRAPSCSRVMDPDKAPDMAPDGSAGQTSQCTQVAAQPTHIGVIPSDITAHGHQHEFRSWYGP